MKPPMDANERELILKEEVVLWLGALISELHCNAHDSVPLFFSPLASIRVHSRLSL